MASFFQNDVIVIVSYKLSKYGYVLIWKKRNVNITIVHTYKFVTPGTHMWTICAYMWTGLQTCVAPFANNSHTIQLEPKFVSFLRKHKGNWVPWEALGVLCSPQVNRSGANCLHVVCMRVPVFTLQSFVCGSARLCIHSLTCLGSSFCEFESQCLFFQPQKIWSLCKFWIWITIFHIVHFEVMKIRSRAGQPDTPALILIPRTSSV